ncbi:hypothetical protein MMC07_009532 [Pseudocyphellaria aurata]|nr:hypothetical protein [Pseudocyphellaria aurata]
MPRPLENAPAINSNRPQTLKQAKKAHRKAGARPRFSDVELRRLARAAELQERADRIREREKKRKVNRKKKEEKEDKEREARRKAGLPETREAYVGPSQLKLAFPGACREDKKGKFYDESSDASGNERAHTDKTDKTDKQGVCNSVETPCRISRRPLQPKSPNVIIKPKSPLAVSKDKRCKNSDHDWLDFVVSNTQIEQELSTPEIKTFAISVPEPELAHHDDASDLLALICTQDLESSIKSSPVRIARVVEKSAAPSEASTDDFGSEGVYTEEDLQDLKQDLELKSTCKQKLEPEDDAVVDSKKSETCTENAASSEAESFYDEYAPSSQELLALVRNNNFDEFDLTTQDLQNLEP